MREDRCQGEEDAGEAVDGQRNPQPFRPLAVKQPDGKDRAGDVCGHGPVGVGLGDHRLEGDEKDDGNRKPDQELFECIAIAPYGSVDCP
jgi:hypothetical protein